jgi:hypothetical protein
MSKSVRHHMYDLYVEIVLKHAEQTEQLWSNNKIQCLLKVETTEAGNNSKNYLLM